MADSKRGRKQVKRKEQPNVRPTALQSPSPAITQRDNPDSSMQQRPVWKFADCDTDLGCEWALHKRRLRDIFWDVIFPRLRQFEGMTWGEILIKAKKQNHYIEVEHLNKVARDRLADLQIEAEDICSLRLGGKLRLYGLLIGSVYHILWYDDNHGDNETCICRSKLKHT